MKTETMAKFPHKYTLWNVCRVGMWASSKLKVTARSPHVMKILERTLNWTQ